MGHYLTIMFSTFGGTEVKRLSPIPFSEIFFFKVCNLLTY